MEFENILQLPEEKIVEICTQMDNFTLTRFLQVSKDTNRICNQVLTDRYNILAEQILEEDKKHSLDLITNKKLISFKLYYLDLFDKFVINEILGPFTFITEELGSPWSSKKSRSSKKVRLYLTK